MNVIDHIDIRYLFIAMCMLLGVFYFMLMNMVRMSPPKIRKGQYVAAWVLLLLPIGITAMTYWTALMLYRQPEGNVIMRIHEVSVVSVRYDEAKKALVASFSWDGKSQETVLKMAGRVDANNDVYTEECLREAAKNWKPGSKIDLVDQDH